MFSTTNPELLKKALDRFKVPMYVVERTGQNYEFSVACANRTYELVTGRSVKDLIGRTPSELLEAKDAEILSQRFVDCATGEKLTNFEEPVSLSNKVAHWETTLQLVEMPNDTQRIVATTTSVQVAAAPYSISDAEFFAAQAQLQLTQMQYFLEGLEDSAELPDHVRSHAQMVSGLARSLNRVLSDLRDAASPPEPQAMQASASATAAKSGADPLENYQSINNLRHCLSDA